MSVSSFERTNGRTRRAEALRVRPLVCGPEVCSLGAGVVVRASAHRTRARFHHGAANWQPPTAHVRGPVRPCLRRALLSGLVSPAQAVSPLLSTGYRPPAGSHGFGRGCYPAHRPLSLSRVPCVTEADAHSMWTEGPSPLCSRLFIARCAPVSREQVERLPMKWGPRAAPSSGDTSSSPPHACSTARGGRFGPSLLPPRGPGSRHASGGGGFRRLAHLFPTHLSIARRLPTASGAQATGITYANR